MSVLLVFIDGIGFGTPGAHNPFDGAARGVLRPLAGTGKPAPEGWSVQAVDACLGVEGFPQSATGTGTIVTGVNCAQAIGEHFWAYPDERIAAIIEEHSILRRVRDRGRKSGYLNAFPAERADPDADVPRAACTCAALAGGGGLRTLEHLAARRAATFDLTHEVARGLGLDLAPRSMREAAEAVALGAREMHLALFELFLTDKAGHSRQTFFARNEVIRTERFLHAVIDFLDPERDLLIAVSDHGNLEDISTRGHTLNLVPVFSWGAGAQSVTSAWRDLADVGRGVFDLAMSANNAPSA